MNITSEQIRAGRALLRIEQEELARRAHVSAATIRRLESPEGAERVAAGTILAIRRALEEAGFEFVPDGVQRRARGEDRESLIRDLMAIGADLPVVEPGFSESDLYDDNGVPA